MAYLTISHRDIVRLSGSIKAQELGHNQPILQYYQMFHSVSAILIISGIVITTSIESNRSATWVGLAHGSPCPTDLGLDMF